MKQFLKAIHRRYDDWKFARHSDEKIHAGYLPPSLTKAMMDNFDYAMGLTNGMEIRFTSAAYLNREWVHLRLPGYQSGMDNDSLPHSFQRGIDVQIDQIVWCADAPDGS